MFDGQIKRNQGQKVIIEEGLVEEELVAKWMEAHVGFQIVTEHQKQERKEIVGVSTVVNAFH